MRGSSQVCAPRPRFPRQAGGERNQESQSTDPTPASPDPIKRVHAGKAFGPDNELHAMRPNLLVRGACSLQSSASRNKPRSGAWLRSLYNLFGLGKQQEAASILAAVRAATPVGQTATRVDRAGIKRWQTRPYIEHEDL